MHVEIIMFTLLQQFTLEGIVSDLKIQPIIINMIII